jgi:hypothetical protein
MRMPISIDPRTEETATLPRRPDCRFIDGEHSHDAVVSDARFRAKATDGAAGLANRESSSAAGAGSSAWVDDDAGDRVASPPERGACADDNRKVQSVRWGALRLRRGAG